MSEENLENPVEKLDKIISFFDEEHEALTKAALEIGKVRDDLISIRPLIISFENSESKDPEYLSLISTTKENLADLSTYIHLIDETKSNYLNDLNFAAGTATHFITTSGSTSAFNPELAPVIPKSVFDVFLTSTPFDHNNLGDRLTNFDKDLGNAYKEVWEVLYNTRADPERAALFSFRQVFDHFFYKLSPDDEVRASPYWQKKDNNNPDQIFRIERIEFAAHKHITDEDKRGFLLSSAKHMLEVYDSLNRAHTRGEINTHKARMALEEMHSFIKLWADSINI